MIPVKQTDFTLVTGNCIAACFASILELPLDEVPHCIAADDWWQQYKEWARERFGAELVCYEVDDWEPPEDVCVILAGITESGKNHCVVYYNGEEVWCPSGSSKKLATRLYWFPMFKRDGCNAAMKEALKR